LLVDPDPALLVLMNERAELAEQYVQAREQSLAEAIVNELAGRLPRV